MAETQKRLLSVIAPMFNEEEGFGQFMSVLPPFLETIAHKHGVDWELLLIDDGSTDYTPELIADWAQREPRVRGIVFSRNFGKEAALTAGLAHARGDAVIPIDADLQDPPEVMDEMVTKWLRGAEVVVGVRGSREADNPLKRVSSSLFYKVFNRLAQRSIPVNAGDFRLLDRKVVNVLNQMHERNRFMKGLFSWVGFTTEFVVFARKERSAGKTKWNYWKLFNFALDGVTSFSTVPLRIWSAIGLGVSFISFCFILWIILKTLVLGEAVQGFPTIMVSVLFLGGLQLMGIGIIGEYLGRLYQEAKQRPLYIVSREIGGSGEEVD